MNVEIFPYKGIMFFIIEGKINRKNISKLVETNEFILKMGINNIVFNLLNTNVNKRVINILKQNYKITSNVYFVNKKNYKGIINLENDLNVFKYIKV
ncbi:MAG: hypothetical protein R3Y21_02940 [Mycoplasmatota bacterium]